MRLRSVGLLLLAWAALQPTWASAAPTLTMSSGQKDSFGLNDCNANAKRVISYEGTAGYKLTIFMATGSCPDAVVDGQTTYLFETKLTTASTSGSIEVFAQQVTKQADKKGAWCPVDDTIERHLCAVEKTPQVNYTTGATTWEVGEKADLTLTYDSEPPGAPALKEATGGEGQTYLTWDGGSGATEWLVCAKKVGEPAEQSDDPCGTTQSQTQAIERTGCEDGTLDNTETDIDCGGGLCPKCADTYKCLQPSDCFSGVCHVTCQAPACDDTVQNGGESDKDCGGELCPKCADTSKCAQPSDCVSGACIGSVCVPASCGNGGKDGNESDVDCGGGLCPQCADTHKCTQASDCVSGVCTGSVCVAASCGNTAKDGDETDIDCGGALCPKCADTRECAQASDCASNVCTDLVCEPASCSSKAKDGDETDIDCGGSCSANCDDGEACTTADDCASDVCTGSVCVAATCRDKVKNGTETEVDCGGTCDGCGAGLACAKNEDCASQLCTEGKCELAVNENPFAGGCDSLKAFTGASTRKGTLDGLVNGQTYSLQMVARDEAGNYSAVSGTKEATPEPVFDFYERYRCSGGTETGGFGCSSGGMALLPLAGLAALGLLLRRRNGRNA